MSSGDPKTSPKRFKQRMKNANWGLKIHNYRSHWKQGKVLFGGSSTRPPPLAERLRRYDMIFTDKCSD